MAQVNRRSVLGGIAATSALMATGSSRSATAAQRAPKIALETVLARAESAKRRGTKYALYAEPPSERLAAWPRGHNADCSGFVGWCVGLPRTPRQIGVGTKLGTDQIYKDATADKALFTRIDAPEIGDIVLYPNYQIAPGVEGTPGHVALITAVRVDGSYDTIECASTPFHKTGDAIAFDRADTIFRGHAIELTRIRKAYPNLPADKVRDPIFARYLGLVR
ncbi:CHAP domain-containing protein [Sphingomonas soli]|uniref:CHAP domain-containing protein n=1 Tax=Sphingomonas soli TaxID=266127 RepID=UPI000AB8B92B|nr:CHAP domain-containing protein [Sphingomonas soli]